MKRTKYIVHCPDGHVARFSEQWHARVFAIALSERMPGHWIEMSAPDGLIGQYRGGKSTPEFEQHHIAAAGREDKGLDAKQVLALQALIARSGSDIQGFCAYASKFAGTPIVKLEDIPQFFFEKLKDKLLRFPPG